MKDTIAMGRRHRPQRPHAAATDDLRVQPRAIGKFPVQMAADGPGKLLRRARSTVNQHFRCQSGLIEEPRGGIEGGKDEVCLPKRGIGAKNADHLRDLFAPAIAIERWQQSADVQVKLRGELAAHDELVKLTVVKQLTVDKVERRHRVRRQADDQCCKTLVAERELAGDARHRLYDARQGPDFFDGLERQGRRSAELCAADIEVGALFDRFGGLSRQTTDDGEPCEIGSKRGDHTGHGGHAAPGM